MSRPVVTAIHLEEQSRAGAPICVPRNALITPAARDWFKDHGRPIVWEDAPEPDGRTLAAVLDPGQPSMRAVRSLLERLFGTVEVIAPASPGVGPLASAIRRLCGKIRRREVARGVVLTLDMGVALTVANKHDGIRAVLGTGLAAVEEAGRELGANVLVIDTRVQATFLIRQMVERLMNGPSSPPPEMLAMLESIERSDGREDW